MYTLMQRVSIRAIERGYFVEYNDTHSIKLTREYGAQANVCKIFLIDSTDSGVELSLDDLEELTIEQDGASVLVTRKDGETYKRFADKLFHAMNRTTRRHARVHYDDMIKSDIVQHYNSLNLLELGHELELQTRTIETAHLQEQFGKVYREVLDLSVRQVDTHSIARWLKATLRWKGLS